MRVERDRVASLESRETVSSETDPSERIPRAPSVPVPANKKRAGAGWSARAPACSPNRRRVRTESPTPKLRRVRLEPDATRRARLYRKIDLAFAFDLQGDSVLDGPDDRDEDGASRATDMSDESGTRPEERGAAGRRGQSRVWTRPEARRRRGRSRVWDSSGGTRRRRRGRSRVCLSVALWGPERVAKRRNVRARSGFFPNLPEDSFDDGEGASTFPSPHAARRSPRGEKSARAAFVDVGPELDPDVARAGFGGVSSSKREGHKAAPLRRGGVSARATPRGRRENELRWRKERREREKRKLEDERRRFEVLQLELEAIEARRLEQARAREDKKAAEAGAPLGEGGKQKARATRAWRLAGENQGKRLMAEQMERRRGLFPASLWAFMKLGLGANPCTCACRSVRGPRRDAGGGDPARRAGGETRAKTGGAKKSRFQTVFENSRVPEKTRRIRRGRRTRRDTDESAAFLPPLSANDQAAARFARQRRYGQIVKRLHAARVDPDARAEDRAAPTPIGRLREPLGVGARRVGPDQPNRWSPPVQARARVRREGRRAVRLGQKGARALPVRERSRGDGDGFRVRRRRATTRAPFERFERSSFEPRRPVRAVPERYR